MANTWKVLATDPRLITILLAPLVSAYFGFYDWSAHIRNVHTPKSLNCEVSKVVNDNGGGQHIFQLSTSSSQYTDDNYEDTYPNPAFDFEEMIPQ